jgi:hypothetical protein
MEMLTVLVQCMAAVYMEMLTVLVQCMEACLYGTADSVGSVYGSRI